MSIKLMMFGVKLILIPVLRWIKMVVDRTRFIYGWQAWFNAKQQQNRVHQVQREPTSHDAVGEAGTAMVFFSVLRRDDIGIIRSGTTSCP
ncbi:hypothetical protein A2U01_0058337 [Trifolium medium]|uniref:Secreted protein n=1 Tax=Trifolium medium TaxID=97028 RepID=A0A392RKG5_9FABA|nr:hypothetical protein [Trifolium medium]